MMYHMAFDAHMTPVIPFIPPILISLIKLEMSLYVWPFISAHVLSCPDFFLYYGKLSDPIIYSHGFFIYI